MAVRHYKENSRPPVSTFPLVYIGMLAIVGYTVFLVVHSVWAGIQVSTQVAQEQASLDQANLQEAVQERYIQYQKTDSFIEKQAREHFGYAKPGETIVILPQNKDQSEIVQDEQAGITAQKSQHVIASSARSWWEYFFGKE